MTMKSWNATDAKRHFAEVISEAEQEPQVVTKRGKPVSVVVSYERFLANEMHHRERSVGQWLEDLRTWSDLEADPDTPERTSRGDQFGDEWR
ncbi:MAG: type II toxin-antitoxin system Phd/YefM family antitoxin [Spirochaetaceae bacterium]|nr:MAG: type II toxin-antitoxin system Phd/YefM family antitoxin [Spirochaetaceae bacterium]